MQPRHGCGGARLRGQGSLQIAEAGIRAIAKASLGMMSANLCNFILAVMLPPGAGSYDVDFRSNTGKEFFRRHPSALAGWIFLLLYLALRQSQE